MFVRFCGNEDFQAEIVLAAGLEQVEPAGAAPRYEVDLGRLGSGRGVVDQEFVLTTPAGEPFSFDLIARSDTNAGDVVLGLGHVRDGAAAATGGAESMARAGCIPTGPGVVNEGPWLSVWGDGFARMTVTGRIDREQVFLVRDRSMRAASNTPRFRLCWGRLRRSTTRVER